jgi:hypothetical protein
VSFLDRAAAWIGSNFVPLVLVPLAVVLLWIAVWRIWLPPVGGAGLTARTVTTVDAAASARPTHKVTTVVRTTRGSAPSRRSEVLALALIFLSAGAAVIAVFHRRIGSLEVDKDGIKLDLTPDERSGAAALVSRLAGAGAAPPAYAHGLDRYVKALAQRRRPHRALEGASVDGDATSLANRIADDLV